MAATERAAEVGGRLAGAAPPPLGPPPPDPSRLPAVPQALNLHIAAVTLSATMQLVAIHRLQRGAFGITASQAVLVALHAACLLVMLRFPLRYWQNRYDAGVPCSKLSPHAATCLPCSAPAAAWLQGVAGQHGTPGHVLAGAPEHARERARAGLARSTGRARQRACWISC